MELTIEDINSFLEKNPLNVPFVDVPLQCPYTQTDTYEPKKRPIVGSNIRHERPRVEHERPRVEHERPRVEHQEPIQPKISQGKTLWEALLPFVDPSAPLFTQTMKQEASTLLSQTIRDTLMGEWAVRYSKPTSVRACLKALDQPELKVAMDTMSWTVLATLFHDMWDCNILLKEKQKEIIKGFNCFTTLKIEHTKTEWLISKI